MAPAVMSIGGGAAVDMPDGADDEDPDGGVDVVPDGEADVREERGLMSDDWADEPEGAVDVIEACLTREWRGLESDCDPSSFVSSAAAMAVDVSWEEAGRD